MKRGSKAIKCEECGRTVGWIVPTGVYDHGIPRVEYREGPECVTVDRGFRRSHFCKLCYNLGEEEE